MIVLHALWDALALGKLHIWAESSSMPTGFPASTSTRRAADAQQPRPHPFALTAHDALAEAVSGLVGNLAVQGADKETLTLRLPSTNKEPLSSPELLWDTERNEAQAVKELRWWTVNTIALDASHALDTLLSLPNNLPYSVAIGSSTHFWATVANFSYELMVRQCYVPTLQELQHGRMTSCRAMWEATLSSEDAERLSMLAAMMPPLCWSFLPQGDKKASLREDFVRNFLNQTIDAFVRDSLSTTSLLPSKGNRRVSAKALPEQWLKALSSENPILTGSADELKQFTTTMRTWLGQLQPVVSDAPFRTCFRLDPPETEENSINGANGTQNDEAWHVSFHLQANDDRSLLVPAEQVWQERSSTMTFLKRTFENPQERLLADLGRASRLFPPIEESLKEARPQELLLTTEEAYTFLRQSAPLLEQSGFGVLVPPWWQKKSARLRVKLKIKPKAGTNSEGLLGLAGLVDYDWNAAIGDTTLSEQEFEHLVNLKMPLIQIRGQWVELQPEEIEAAIAFFKKKHAGNMSLGDALRLGLGQEQTEVGLQVTEVEAEGWIQHLLAGLADGMKIETINVPSTLQGTLRPYQLKGVSWMTFLRKYGLGACLADDMGLGKTIVLIATLLNEKYISKFPLEPTLVICPMSIVGNWQRELQRFAPSLRVMVHHGHERLSGQAFEEEARMHDVVITTYSLALRDKEHLGLIEWDNVVIDEAQNIKNESAKQTQAIKQLKAQYKIALTGTPVENRLSELWSIMEFLNPGYLGSGDAFRKSFAIPIERHHNAERAEMLKRLIQPFVLRRVKTDKEIIKDLPDKMEMKVFCNLTQEQASLYEAVVKDMMEKIEAADGIERKGMILATLTKLKQVCNHPAQFMSDGSRLSHRSGKLERLEEMLEEVLAAGDKALIFTQYAQMGTLLRTYLQETLGCETLFLHGGVQKKQRDIMVQRFQEERRGAPLFILSLKAGGVGLNLTAANHVFHFDRWWNPAVENQATDRAFRIGQQRNVQVHKFVCAGTLEERIDMMIEQKKVLAESIVGSGESWLTEMSTNQLKELFALSRDAVAE